MANLKSSKKDLRRTARRTAERKPFARNAKMTTRKVRKLITAGKVEEATKMLPETFKALDKAARKNIIHPNNASRTKSRIAKALASASASAK